jgi:hypothetical protein
MGGMFPAGKFWKEIGMKLKPGIGTITNDIF